MQSIRVTDRIRLEPATLEDALFLFDLKNEEGARLSALVTKGHITWAAHVAWLRKTLADVNVELYVIVMDGKRVGSWRYDFYPDRVEFAMVLTPETRGQRVGSTVFNFCGDRIQDLTTYKIVGYIAEGNVPPMRYHMRAGYQLESYDKERRCYVWTRDRDAFLVRKSQGLCANS